MFRFAVIGALASASLLAVSANAADIYRAPEGVSYKDGPVYEPVWTGFYAGFNGGYAWNPSDNDTVSATPVRSGTSSESFSGGNGFGGGQIGYNWLALGSGSFKDGYSAGHLLLGIEADLQGAGSDSSAIANSNTLGNVAAGRTGLEWFGTVRGRIGYAAGSNLFYFTGGFAAGGVKDTLSVGAYGFTTDKTATETGYVLGGGVERFISPRWSVKAEYQYIDLSSTTLSASPAPGYKATLNTENTFNTARLGFNYHFGTSYEPLK